MKKLAKRPLSIPDILRWANAYRKATGRWPTQQTGPVAGAFRETWLAIDTALRCGLRGLEGGSSLARLLAERRGARLRSTLPPLTEEIILAWCDAYFQATGKWPTAKSGPVVGTKERWENINQALYQGVRGLPGGSSLARLLNQHRGVRNRKALQKLTDEMILAWCDAHHDRTGRWPKRDSGTILESPTENWRGIDNGLRLGLRSLPGGSSLARLLAERRSVGDYCGKAPISTAQILAWADVYRQRNGRWPTLGDGAVFDAPSETWKGLDGALRKGHRTLPVGSSLAKLLAAERGARHLLSLPKLTRRQILAWADSHRTRTGAWPTEYSGPIPEAPGETWAAVNGALRFGKRGLRSGLTLAQLLAHHRGKRLRRGQPPLSKRRILAWADAHRERTGSWPRAADGSIPEAKGGTWATVDNALREGLRGQPGGSSLARLLARKRGVRNQAALPPLTTEQVLNWADAHRLQTGRWPTTDTGAVLEEPGQTWRALDAALRQGLRGFPGGLSLARLLTEKRGVRNGKALPRLTEDQIRVWAEAHLQQTGQWPTSGTGPVADAPGELWAAIDRALQRGQRGLPGGSSLRKLLKS